MADLTPDPAFPADAGPLDWLPAPAALEMRPQVLEHAPRTGRDLAAPLRGALRLGHG